MAEHSQKKYDDDFKKQWVARRLQGGQTLKALAQEAQIRPETLSDWVKAHKKANPGMQKAAPTKEPTASSPPKPQKAKASPKRPATKKSSPRTATAPSQHPAGNSTEAQLRQDLKVALEERDVLKRALRILSASD